MGPFDFLNRTATVQRESVTRDSAGGQVKTWATVGTPACCVWPTKVETRREFSRKDAVADYEVATAVDPQTATNDRIMVDGVTYLVLGRRDYVASYFGPSIYVTVVSRRNQP